MKTIFLRLDNIDSLNNAKDMSLLNWKDIRQRQYACTIKQVSRYQSVPIFLTIHTIHHLFIIVSRFKTFSEKFI